MELTEMKELFNGSIRIKFNMLVYLMFDETIISWGFLIYQEKRAYLIALFSCFIGIILY
tara:strand:+ start:1197 stop:1373 length:177 start_codon:yes stop_codon:yes gene_type:complete